MKPANGSQFTAEEVAAMERPELEKQFLNLQRSFGSMHNAINLYKRQLSAVRDHSLKSSQIADLSHNVNSLDAERVVMVAVRDVANFFEAGYAALYLYHKEAELLTLKKSHPESPAQPDLDMAHEDDYLMVHMLKKHREPLVVESIEEYEKQCGKELRLAPADKPLLNGALICPLVIGHSDSDMIRAGILAIGDKPSGFTMQDAEIATFISDMLAGAISNSRLLEQMKYLAETDGLTRLFNHRHFQQALDRQVASSQRYSRELSLAILDIDYFKKFNDTHGHQAGDVVLREVAQAISRAVRDQVDIVARYGGEEFAVIMPETPIEGGITASGRIRQNIEAAGVRVGDKRLNVTVSIGVASLQENQSKDELIAAADEALYLAKAGGRNCVVKAENKALNEE